MVSFTIKPFFSAAICENTQECARTDIFWEFSERFRATVYLSTSEYQIIVNELNINM